MGTRPLHSRALAGWASGLPAHGLPAHVEDVVDELGEDSRHLRTGRRKEQSMALLLARKQVSLAHLQQIQPPARGVARESF